LRKAYAEGISWADAKNRVFERLDLEITPMRERYEALMRDPAAIEDILLRGAAKARKISAPFMASLRHAVGLRNLATQSQAKTEKSSKAALPTFKQYRERDGLFRFKLVDANGRLLLESLGFDSPKDAGLVIGKLQGGGAAALREQATQVTLAHGVAEADVHAALRQLAGAT